MRKENQNKDIHMLFSNLNGNRLNICQLQNDAQVPYHPFQHCKNIKEILNSYWISASLKKCLLILDMHVTEITNYFNADNQC